MAKKKPATKKPTKKSRAKITPKKRTASKKGEIVVMDANTAALIPPN